MGAISFSLDENLLGKLTRELPLRVFVETGTFHGDSLDIARRFFNECHSIEMSEVLFTKVKARFEGDPKVHLHLGSSPELLRRHQSQFASQPVLFWLDAHWCVAGDTAGEDSQTPLIDELKSIGRLHPESVLLIDDARLYLCAPPKPHHVGDWPDIDEICRILFTLSSGHRMIIYNDVIIYYPKKIEDALRQFSHENGTDWLILAHQAREKIKYDQEQITLARQVQQTAEQDPIKQALELANPPKGFAGWVARKKKKIRKIFGIAPKESSAK